MKKVIFILLLIAHIELQAQNSDLYNQVISVQQSHFANTSSYPIGTTALINVSNKSIQGTLHTGQKVKVFTPILVFDGQIVYKGVESETLVRNTLNSYTLNQIAGIDYWRSTNKEELDYATAVYGSLGENGIIFIYSHTYTAVNPNVRQNFKISF
jgi:hypothetical protein